MRLLEQALQDHELITLRVIGEWWELELAGSDKGTCVKALAAMLAQLDIVQEMAYLPAEDASALSELVSHGGRVPVNAFSREHGEVRLMGPGRLERDEPWLDPVSAAESLWYRGLLYRGFDETGEGMIEFYYLPQELLAKFPQSSQAAAIEAPPPAALNPAPAPERFNPAVTEAVDDLTTLLALAQLTSLQLGQAIWSQRLVNPDSDRRSLLVTLATETGLLRMVEGGLRPARASVDWLKQSREAQLRFLADGWSSSAWNDLCHTPGLACEGEGWHNDPIQARTAILDGLPRSAEWFAVTDLVAMIKESDPDFQRPDSNYDTWYIRDIATDQYVTGIENWDLVEGRLIPYIVEVIFYWLGLVETAGRGQDRVYRLTPRALDWLADRPPAADAMEVPLVVQADCSVKVPYNAGRYQRFQMARISEALPFEPGQPYLYRLTPHSMEVAREQGINPERILSFLQEASGRPLPASVKRAISRWAEIGVEGRLESAIILRVRDADILQTLRSNPRTRDYIDESLGDLAAMVRRPNWLKLVSAAAQLGLLLDTDIES